MPSTAEQIERRYTYTDYIKWTGDERFEIIEGIVYSMSPAPSPEHQAVSGELFGYIWQHLQNKSCRVFTAPFDVRLPEKPDDSDENIYTVVQPDISVICDKVKVDDRGAIGAPDIVIEVILPSTAYKDENFKMMLYEKHGVKEYWIVSPAAKFIMIYRHNGAGFDKPQYYKENEILESRVLHGLKISLPELWSKTAI